MSARYTYLNGHPPMGSTCVLCGSKAFYTYLDRNDPKYPVPAYVCYSHKDSLKGVYIKRNDTDIVYRILSGWPNNPVWDCEMEFHPEEVVDHLHTTKDAGMPPDIYQGQGSGLFFKAHGTWWPIEAREGRLIVVIYENDVRQEKDITVQAAIELLSGAGD